MSASEFPLDISALLIASCERGKFRDIAPVRSREREILRAKAILRRQVHVCERGYLAILRRQVHGVSEEKLAILRRQAHGAPSFSERTLEIHEENTV